MRCPTCFKSFTSLPCAQFYCSDVCKDVHWQAIADTAREFKSVSGRSVVPQSHPIAHFICAALKSHKAHLNAAGDFSLPSSAVAAIAGHLKLIGGVNRFYWETDAEFNKRLAENIDDVDAIRQYTKTQRQQGRAVDVEQQAKRARAAAVATTEEQRETVESIALAGAPELIYMPTIQPFFLSSLSDEELKRVVALHSDERRKYFHDAMKQELQLYMYAWEEAEPALQELPRREAAIFKYEQERVNVRTITAKLRLIQELRDTLPPPQYTPVAPPIVMTPPLRVMPASLVPHQTSLSIPAPVVRVERETGTLASPSSHASTPLHKFVHKVLTVPPALDMRPTIRGFTLDQEGNFVIVQKAEANIRVLVCKSPTDITASFPVAEQAKCALRLASRKEIFVALTFSLSTEVAVLDDAGKLKRKFELPRIFDPPGTEESRSKVVHMAWAKGGLSLYVSRADDIYLLDVDTGAFASKHFSIMQETHLLAVSPLSGHLVTTQRDDANSPALNIFASDLSTHKIRLLPPTRTQGIAIDANQHIYIYEGIPAPRIKVYQLESMLTVFILTHSFGLGTWPLFIVNFAVASDGNYFVAENTSGKASVYAFRETYARLPDVKNEIIRQRHNYRQLKPQTVDLYVPPTGWVGHIPLRLEGPQKVMLLRYKIEIAIIGEYHYKGQMSEERTVMCPDDKFSMKITDYIQLVGKQSKNPVLLCIEKDPDLEVRGVEHTVLDQLTSLSSTFHDIMDTLTTEGNIRVLDVDLRRGYGEMGILVNRYLLYVMGLLTDVEFVAHAEQHIGLIKNFLHSADMEFALAHTLPEVARTITETHAEYMRRISLVQPPVTKAIAFFNMITHFLDFYALAVMFHPDVSCAVFYGGLTHAENIRNMLFSLGAEMVGGAMKATKHCTMPIELSTEPHFFSAPLRSSFYSSPREHFALWLERPDEYFEFSDNASTLSLLRYARPCFMNDDDPRRGYTALQLATDGQVSMKYAEDGGRFALFLYTSTPSPQFVGAKSRFTVAVYVYSVYSEDIREKLALLKQILSVQTDVRARALVFGSGSTDARWGEYTSIGVE